MDTAREVFTVMDTAREVFTVMDTAREVFTVTDTAREVYLPAVRLNLRLHLPPLPPFSGFSAPQKQPVDAGLCSGDRTINTKGTGTAQSVRDTETRTAINSRLLHF